MPISLTDDGDESLHDHEEGNGSKENFREQDIYLPIANVARIMKNAVPQTGKVWIQIKCSLSRGEYSWCRLYSEMLAYEPFPTMQRLQNKIVTNTRNKIQRNGGSTSTSTRLMGRGT